MKRMLLLALILAFASTAMAQETYYFGWETGTPDILSVYGGDPGIINTIATDPVHGGTYSLQLEDNAASGTPNVSLAWIRGLEEGDVVIGGFWRYDTTPGAAPNCRIWANWNDDPTDVTVYSGSASGNSDYGLGEGWDYTEYEWTVPAERTGLVIVCRTYSNAGDIVWIDDIQVTIPSRDGVSLVMPQGGGPVATDAATMSQIKALY